MFRSNNRYDDYYLVNDMDEIGFDEVPKKCCSRRCKIIGFSTCLAVVVFAFSAVFVILPVVFMTSESVQRALIFTRFNLPCDKKYFQEYRLPGYRNLYITVNDAYNGTNKSLGVWHLLPMDLAYESLHFAKFDYDEALQNSKYGVLIYFHGTGEARSYSTKKYRLLRSFFHIIAFDYRSYADSFKGVLSEKAVVDDCIHLYKWVLNKTDSPIYVWGQSLGSSLATSTLASLENSNITSEGLVLESAFTSLRDELYVHPYGKMFSWLPWFEATILNPLYKNGFIFDTALNILNVSCPIMILHARDDSIVPYKFGRMLFQIASNRSEEAKNNTFYYEFQKDLGYNHNFIYEDPYFQYFVMDFIGLNKKSGFY